LPRDGRRWLWSKTRRCRCCKREEQPLEEEEEVEQKDTGIPWKLKNPKTGGHGLSLKTQKWFLTWKKGNKKQHQRSLKTQTPKTGGNGHSLKTKNGSCQKYKKMRDQGTMIANVEQRKEFWILNRSTDHSRRNCGHLLHNQKFKVKLGVEYSSKSRDNISCNEARPKKPWWYCRESPPKKSWYYFATRLCRKMFGPAGRANVSLLCKSALSMRKL